MKRSILVAFIAVLGLGVLLPAPSTYAVEVFNECQEQSSSVCNGSNDAPSMVKTAINASLYVLGMVAVLMIVIGGIRYATSAGDAAQVKSAKNTILYAIVGLVVAIMAFTIINFVLNWFK
jgi:hypothetical protein